MLQAGRSPTRIPDEVAFFNLPNPSSRTMVLGSTRPQTEISTRNLPVGKEAARIATGYGLDDQEAGVRVSVGSKIFSSPNRPYRLWGPSNLLSNGYRGLFPRG
jgi:hypothetical protein